MKEFIARVTVYSAGKPVQKLFYVFDKINTLATMAHPEKIGHNTLMPRECYFGMECELEQDCLDGAGIMTTEKYYRIIDPHPQFIFPEGIDQIVCTSLDPCSATIEVWDAVISKTNENLIDPIIEL